MCDELHGQMEQVRLLLYTRLPLDIVELILHHLACVRIQQKWLRYVHYAHTRQRQKWDVFRCSVHVADKWRFLALFSDVRREWRVELDSWCAVDTSSVDIICEECARGMWGQVSHRLLTL